MKFSSLSSSVKPNLPANFRETTWEKLQAAVQAIHHKRAITYSLEELYKAVENMCSHKMATTLYDQLKTECEVHVRSNMEQFVAYPFYRETQHGVTEGDLLYGQGRLWIFQCYDSASHRAFAIMDFCTALIWDNI